MQNFLILVGVGLVNFFFIGNIVDSFVDSFVDKFAFTKISLLIRNIVRPIISTLIIFGGGTLAIYWTSVGIPNTILSFVFYFGLTYLACMTGRTVTYFESGGAMIATMILILVLFSFSTGTQPVTSANHPVGGITKQDDQRADPRKAAEQGDAQAQYFLGGMFRDGLGVKQDDAQAVEWYRKAAKQGHNESKQALKELGKQ